MRPLIVRRGVGTLGDFTDGCPLYSSVLVWGNHLVGSVLYGTFDITLLLKRETERP